MSAMVQTSSNDWSNFYWNREQLLATLSAQANVLQEAKDELSKLRRADEHQYELGLKVQQLQAKLDQAYEEISVSWFSIALYPISLVDATQVPPGGTWTVTFKSRDFLQPIVINRRIIFQKWENCWMNVKWKALKT